MTRPTNPIRSIEQLLALDSRDWSITRGDAWLWGIVKGWDDNDPDLSAMDAVARKHSWTPHEIARLRTLHQGWLALAAADKTPLTAEDLDTLPHGTVVVDRHDDVFQLARDPEDYGSNYDWAGMNDAVGSWYATHEQLLEEHPDIRIIHIPTGGPA